MTEAEDSPFGVGRDVYAPDGSKLGTIAGVYDDATSASHGARWLAVDAGVSDGPYLVPTTGAGLFSEGLQVRCSVEQMQSSPRVDPRNGLVDDDLDILRRHYASMIGDASPTNPGPA